MMFGREAAVHDATKTDRSWMDRMALEREGWAVLCYVEMCAVLVCVCVCVCVCACLSPPHTLAFRAKFQRCGLSPHIVFRQQNLKILGSKLCRL
jgi:hypothetical protein